MAVWDDWLCLRNAWNTILFRSLLRIIWKCFITGDWKNGTMKKGIWQTLAWQRKMDIRRTWIILEFHIERKIRIRIRWKRGGAFYKNRIIKRKIVFNTGYCNKWISFWNKEKLEADLLVIHKNSIVNLLKGILMLLSIKRCYFIL